MIDPNKMPKIYQAQQIESEIYRDWTEKGYFHSKPDPAKKPYTIVMPPPNITGQLHMGHALDNTLQDVLIRWRRMQGYCTLWLPGTDHASIATEAKIVEAMEAEGLTKEMIGREKFLERAWEWKRVYGGRIVEQLKRLGSSCDWSRERFTMDEGLSRAVTEVFARLYEKGLIYRGERIINWCPVCRTSISDAEVEHFEKDGNFWYIKYPIKDSSEFITVATTRPETMLGDTAVAVNPEDARFAHLIGKTAILPLLGREIPIIADDYVDKDFGTGAVKITPAHDPNDYDVGQRHNLPSIKAMTDDAKMSDEAGPYAGLDRYAARKRVIEDLTQLGLLVKVEPHKHSVGECYRCGTVIEPMLSRQWFVKMEPLAEPAIDVVKSGELEFVPENFTKIYFNWMENIRDWCISRQLWWGHRIPAYYCGDCGHMQVSRVKITECEVCGSKNVVQDPDTLDTWFSSALWPFSTLGWPDETEDLKYFYPTNVLVTAYDIIFFWVARMIFSGIDNMGEKPFKYVLIHGIIRDAEGRKMSKSLGNGIDPLEIIDTYGTDALRFAMTSGNSPGNDMRFTTDKVEAGRNFANKIWNAARFALSNFDDEPDFSNVDPANYNLADKWILTRMNLLIREVTANLERFETGIAIQKIYEFIWDEFCDWYVELVKPRLYDRESKSRAEALYVLNRTLGTAMKLLHPFMPFITESVYMNLAHGDASIMISAWPEYDASAVYEKEAREMGLIMDAVKSVRNIRAGMNVPPSKKAKVIINAVDAQTADIFRQGALFFEKLAWASETVILENSENIEGNNVTAVVSGAQIIIPLDELVDVSKEIERLTKEKDGLMKEIERANMKLTNEGFISKAPSQVIDEEKAKLAKYTEMHEMVKEMLKKLGDD